MPDTNRRAFVKGVAAAGLNLGLVSNLPANPVEAGGPGKPAGHLSHLQGQGGTLREI